MARKKTVLYSTTDELLDGYYLKVQKGEKQALKIKEYVYLRGKRLSSGNISLFLDVCRNNNRTKHYLGLYLNIETTESVKRQNEETFRIAKTIAGEKNVILQKDENGFALSKKSKTNFISYILFQADEALKKSGNPHGYYYTLQSLAKHIAIYSGNSTTFQHVDKNYILGFIAYLKTAKNFNYKKSNTKKGKDVAISPNTQHNLFMKFKYVIKKAIKADVITINPLDKIEDSDKPKEEGGTREFLTIEEIKKLIATPCKNDIIKRSFLFCCLVGLRYSDVASITWGELEQGNKEETLLRFKVKKTKRGETFPISDEALKWLPDRNNASDEAIIFSLPKNDNANRQLKHWIASSGVKKKVTFHCSRHTAATLNLSLGTPIETVSKLMGHTKIATTQIYAKIIDEKKKEAVNRQNGIFD